MNVTGKIQYKTQAVVVKPTDKHNILRVIYNNFIMIIFQKLLKINIFFIQSAEEKTSFDRISFLFCLLCT